MFGQLPNLPMTFSNSIRFIPDFNDLKVALSQKKTLEWFADFAKAGSHSIFNSKDIGPFFVEIENQIKRHI